jgi:hypothetical protein
MLAAMGGGHPPPGAATLPGQPPFGSMPLTPPVPPRGLEAEGASLVANAKELLEKAIATPGMGAETKLGQAVLKCLELIGKELADGTVTPGQQNAGMQQFLLARRQTNPMEAIARAIGGPAGGAPPPGAPPGMPPGGGGPPAPTPGGGPMPPM